MSDEPIKSYCLGHGGEADPRVSREQAALYKALGATSVESYVTWQSVEAAGEGRWDWEIWDRLTEILADNNLKWVPFLIASPAYATPEWYRREYGLPCRCVEHGKDSKIESLWSPSIKAYAERFVRAFAGRYGNKGIIESVLLGIQGDYGEAIYSVKGGGWTYEIPGEYHNHLGFWCGEEPARKAFREYARAKYASPEVLNRAWNTEYASFDEIGYPFESCEEKEILRASLAVCAAHRRHYLDFVEWYRGSMTEYSDWWLGMTRKYFPHEDIFLCTGGVSLPEMGSSFSDQCRVAAKHGAGVRITNEGESYASNFAVTRQVAAAGSFYGAPFGFEPASREGVKGVIARIYNAACSGADQLHDYTYNVEDPAIQAAQQENLRYLIKTNPIVPIAVYYPDVSLSLKPGKFLNSVAELRDYADFDLVDDTLIYDGVLKKYKVLVIMDCSFMEQRTAAFISEWSRPGGRTIIIGDMPVTPEEQQPVITEAERAEDIAAAAPILEGLFAELEECCYKVSRNGVYFTQISPGRFMILNTNSTDNAVFLFRNSCMQTVCARAMAITDYTM